MNLDSELKKIKLKNALKDCFKESFFNACPINDLHPNGYPNKKILHKAHCMKFKDMSDEVIVELKAKALDAIHYKSAWWKLV